MRVLLFAGAVGGLGCVDEPVLIDPPGGGAPAHRLSELGLFADPAAQTPAPGVIAYDVVAPLWSDGADKGRFILAPEPLRVTDDHWDVPAGTYLVKTFGFGAQLVETRVIEFQEGGARFATYVWNGAQTDAIASGGNVDVAVAGGTFHVPGTSQCTMCHDGGALGIRTPQLAAQLEELVADGVADRIPDNVEPFVDPYGDAPLEARAIAYLDANCSHCHRPGGDAADTHADWRRDHLLANVCRAARHDVSGAHLVIAPGRPDVSVAVVRMRASDPFVHMPRGPSHVIDPRGLALVEAWIGSLPETCR